MSNFKSFIHSGAVVGLLVLAGLPAAADTVVQIFSPGGQQEDSVIDWGQLGPDQTQLSSSSNVSSNKGLSANVSLAGAAALISKICAVAPPSAVNCSWTGAGFPNTNFVVWATDGANGGNGPVTVSFAKPVVGAGAFVQPDAPGAFTASIQAFNGSNSLGVFTTTSDSSGDAVYLGVTDKSGANVTSVVFSLSTCVGNCADLAVDNVHLNALAVLVSLSTSSLTFGPQLLNTTSPSQPITLTNVGNQTLNITSITATGEFAQTNTCGTSVPAGGNCTISVTFTPTGIGARSGSVDIKDNSQDGDHRITLSGTGTEGTVSPQSLNFGTQAVMTSSAPMSVTLSNVGTTTMHILGITFGGTNPGDYSETDNCGGKVNAGSSCTINVTFTPQATGPSSAVLDVSDDGGKGTPEEVSVSGIGQ